MTFIMCRYWAVAILSYLTVCLVVAIVLYVAVNLTMVTTFSDPRTIEGKYIYKMQSLSPSEVLSIEVRQSHR